MVGGQHHTTAALPPGMARYPLYRSLVGPQGQCGRVWKNSSPLGFDLRILQPVARCYTDGTIDVHTAFGELSVLVFRGEVWLTKKKLYICLEVTGYKCCYMFAATLKYKSADTKLTKVKSVLLASELGHHSMA